MEKVTHEKIVEAMKKIKSGKAIGLSQVSVEIIVADGEIRVKKMMELCHYTLDGGGMPDEWKTSVLRTSKSGKPVL